MTNKPDKTDFGFEEVSWDEKQHKVNEVFDSIYNQYDLMNDLMSGGLHRLWKKFTVELSMLRPGQRVLDLAGGSGDLTRLVSPKVGASGLVALADINAHMLERGRDRLLDLGLAHNIAYIQANGESLPFHDDYFDCIIIAFGLRNMRDKNAALKASYRTLKPGGKLMVLEFSKPTLPGLAPVYDIYSFTLLPLIGELVANDPQSYRYLAESIRRHPDQQTLAHMITMAGFEDCKYHNLTGGIVALHIAHKY